MKKSSETIDSERDRAWHRRLVRSFFERFDVRSIWPVRYLRDDVFNRGVYPQVVDEVNMCPMFELPAGSAISTVPRKKVPYIRFAVPYEEMEDGTTGILGKLIECLANRFGGYCLLARCLPDMVYVVVLENGCVEVSKRLAPGNHACYVKVRKRNFMTEFNRFALLGYGEKLREILGEFVFECVERCINHQSVNQMLSRANAGVQLPEAEERSEA